MKLRQSRAAGYAILTLIYLAAWLGGYWLFSALPYDFWLSLLLADVGATVLVFVFSVLLKNASVYDPYWSVFPVAAIAAASLGRPLTALNVMHLAVIGLWGIRLTANWAYTFHGLAGQDWRYTMLREKSGAWYPAVNFFGIHLIPTLITYGCSLPALLAIQWQTQGDLLSYFFVLMSLGAVVLQGVADAQMSVGLPLLTRECFGDRCYGQIYSFMNMPIAILGGLGATFVAVVANVTGNFGNAYVCGIAFAVVISICVIIAVGTAKKFKDKWTLEGEPEATRG